MAKTDPEIQVHKNWLGLLQPVGLVVSPPALVKAQAVPSENVAELQQKLLSVVADSTDAAQEMDGEPFVGDLLALLRTALGWEADDIAGSTGGPELPDDLELVLPEYSVTLRPDYVVLDTMGDGKPLMLVQELPRGISLDDVPKDEDRSVWSASPQAKHERLLREVKVPTGLLFNGDALRLVYAPSGESSGYLTFPTPAMCEVSGRPILAAMHMLLSEHRVFSAPDGTRLTDVLSESRKYQAEVSTALSDQVLGALWELLRGFQASDPEDGFRNFDSTAREDPEHVYGGLLTLIMRLVFVLYAEDEGLMPEGEVYANNYSISGLYDRLRADAGRYPDTMDQRHGAYAWLLSLFRLIFDGGGHGGLHLPTRHGQLFNPDEYPFLEGRPRAGGRVMGEKLEAPRVSDGCIHRVLDALLMLGGERLSYRALDVEQIGSVYEAMMGYAVERAVGRCIAVRPKHVVVNVDELLEVDGGKRKKWLKDQAECDLSGASATALKAATTPQDVVAALGRKVSPQSLDGGRTPRLMAPGSLYLQPGEERRRSGSHYTPRELTQPIVETTLRPVLEALGERPTPEQILDLKVCDPAMGSGAFLVEACRQLAEQLVKAWEVNDSMPTVPPDEEPLLHARRLVAQRCLYGVDKNPFAVNLAKLSLWLVTLARDHAFTFLDHALKHGDSLVGLTREQIRHFRWKAIATEGEGLFAKDLDQALGNAATWRATLHGLDESDYRQQNEAWWEAENALHDARLLGDLCISAFFGAEKDKERDELRLQYRAKADAWKSGAASAAEIAELVADLRDGEKPVPPMHWEIEFPEVFGRANPGFDAMVGNPPFLGGNKIWPVLGGKYRDHLKNSHSNSGGKAVDLVAHFLRQAHILCRSRGTAGLIATNTVCEGSTRLAGLRQIVAGGGQIYWVRKRMRWPGTAAVVVSALCFQRDGLQSRAELDGVRVQGINSLFFPRSYDFDPKALQSTRDFSFLGTNIGGAGFTFNDDSTEGTANPVSMVEELSSSDRRNRELIQPYIGGQEVNKSPIHAPHRYVINFRDLPLETARKWPDLIGIIERKVKPHRDTLGGYSVAEGRRERWWQFATYTPALYEAISGLTRVLVTARIGNHLSLTFLPAHYVYSEQLVVFPFDSYSAFCLLQGRPHEAWARLMGSSLKDDLRYSASSCVRPFPFVDYWAARPSLEAAGRSYYDFRAALMIRNNEGLTKTYNRFHDPDERDPDILKLRELHAAMDRAVLDAYGWTDIPTDCEFILDYEIDEETWGRKKKPYRYRWPEEVHDEVLARLLDLNQRRYAEEVAAGLHAEKSSKRPATKKRARNAKSSSSTANLSLFDNPKSSEEA